MRSRDLLTDSDPGSVERLVRTVFLALVCSQGVLVWLDVVVTYFEAVQHPAIQDLCNLVVEGSMGGWFSSAQTLVVGILAWFLRLRAKGTRLRPWVAAGWGIVGAFFVYMAFDDGTGFHEAVATALEDRARSGSLLLSFPSYPWLLLFVPVLGLLGLLTALFAWRVLHRARGRRRVVIGLLCFAAAVALDFVEGIPGPYEHLGAVLGVGEDAVPHTSGVIEEWLEMLGTTFVLCAFLEEWLSSGVGADGPPSSPC